MARLALAFGVSRVVALSLVSFCLGCTTADQGAADGATESADSQVDAPSSCTDANIQLIQASNYDQSCTTASDCIAVGEGNACYPCVIACRTAAISASAKGKYLSDVAKTPAADQDGVFCGCPESFNLCCRGGTCHADSLCQNPAPAGNAGACVAPVGQCVFGGCSNPGPQSCATAGMFCCLTSVPDASTDAADACSPSGCTGSCLSGRHDVSTMVDGCIVTECCVLDDAGTD
jgi:hypothetical protein